MDVSDEIGRLCDQGDDYVYKSDFVAALETYRAAASLLPEPADQNDSTARVYTCIGEVLFYLEQDTAALAYLNDAVRCIGGNGNPYIHLRLGQVLYESKDYRNAAREMMTAFYGGGKDIFDLEDPAYFKFLAMQIDLRPDSTGTLIAAVHEPSNGATTLSTEAGKRMDALCSQGDDLQNEDKFDEALIAYRAAAQIIPIPVLEWEAATWIYTAIGETLNLQGKYEEALDNLRVAIISPDGLGNPFIHLMLGIAYYELNHLEKCCDELARAWIMGDKQIFEGQYPKYFEFISSRMTVD